MIGMHVARYIMGTHVFLLAFLTHAHHFISHLAANAMPWRPDMGWFVRSDLSMAFASPDVRIRICFTAGVASKVSAANSMSRVRPLVADFLARRTILHRYRSMAVQCDNFGTANTDVGGTLLALPRSPFCGHL
jgi:hypothetical protein